MISSTMLERKKVPTLPEELLRVIVKLTSNRDVCNATAACKDFSQLANALSCGEAAASCSSMESLVQFQARRASAGLKVSIVVVLLIHQSGLCQM